MPQIDQYLTLASALIDIEYELRRLGLWQDESPSDQALASKQPFCVDTLDLHQWLQFVFLPKMHHLVDQRLPLPGACAIAPIAEQAYQAREQEVAGLLAQLRQLDRLLTVEE